MLKLSLIVIIFFSFTSCFSYKTCGQFPKSFRSVEEAEMRLSAVECEAHFDSVSFPTGTSIRKAQFFTCDKMLGYLLIVTPDKKLLYRNIPYQYWKNMTKARSFEHYFSQNVQYKFPVYLERELYSPEH